MTRPMPPPAFDDAQIVYLDEHYSGQSSANVHYAMCEECMGRLAVFQGQTLTRSRRRVVIQCPLRCLAPTERVLA